MNNKELVNEVLKMAGVTSPVEKESGGITYHKDRYGYVLGGQGELYTPELAKKWTDMKRSGKHPEYFLSSAKHWYTPPRKIVDCSGMIVQAFRVFNPKYSDRNAANFKSQFVKSGAITAIPEIQGLGVWKSGHIGIYIGNGKVCECRGVNYGVVISKLSTQKWTHYGFLKDVDYGDVPIIISPPSPENPVLKNGAVGESVKRLQELLNALSNAGLKVDGEFGAKTELAVRDFQSKNGLKADGIVGEKTWAVLKTTSPSTPVPTYIFYTVQKGDTLSKIALAFSTTVAEISSLNAINNPNIIVAGQILKIRRI